MKLRELFRGSGSVTITSDVTKSVDDLPRFVVSYADDVTATPITEKADSSLITNGAVPQQTELDGSLTSVSVASGGRPNDDDVTSGSGRRGPRSRRLVRKCGDVRVTSSNVGARGRKYLVDLFTTAIEMRWRYQIVLFFSGFIGTWVFFGFCWLGLAYVDGPPTLGDDNTTWTSPCVVNVIDFRSAVLLSLETQTTIGYGVRGAGEQCDVTAALLMLQSCVGMCMQALLTGVVFAKLSRPKRRGRTIMFSRRAVICKRDGVYQLLFRVGDMRKAHIIGTSLRAVMVRDHVTPEGELIPLCRQPLSLDTDSSGFIFLVWPVTVVHKIADTSSPLWNVSAESLANGPRLEIIVIMEGTVEATGMFTQIRTSYVSSEILWGARLAPLLTYQHTDGRYQIDYGHFHRTIPQSMPDCSASEYEAAWRRATAAGASRPGPRRLQSDPEGRRTWTDVEDAADDATDFSVSFTIQSQPTTRMSASSNPVWKLFNRRQQRQQERQQQQQQQDVGEVVLRRSRTDGGRSLESRDDLHVVSSSSSPTFIQSF